MLQVEFTQQFEITNYVNAAFNFIQLQSTAGVYVVKGLTCYSTVPLSSTGSDSLAIISAPFGGGSTDQYIYSTSASFAANAIIPIFNPLQQIILTQNSLAFRPTTTSVTGLNFVIQISYSFIPNTSSLAVNFCNGGSSTPARYFQLSANVTPTIGAAFTGLSATIPTIIKSFTIVNSGSTVALTVTPLLTTATTTNLAFDNTTTIAAGGSYTYTLPLYLTSAETISIQYSAPSASTFYVIYSYTQDPG